MALDKQPDQIVRVEIRTYNDPRVVGRVGARGERVTFVDSVGGRAYPMIKQGDADTAWEPVYSGTDGAIGDITAAELLPALAALIPGLSTFAIAAQAGTSRDVTVQLRDCNLVNLAAAALARIWISDVAGGAATAVVPDGGVSIQSGVQLDVITTNKVMDVVSTAAGVIVVRITHAAAGTRNYFVNVAIGNMLASSAAVALSN